jgi:hypothetical protein
MESKTNSYYGSVEQPVSPGSDAASTATDVIREIQLTKPEVAVPMKPGKVGILKTLSSLTVLRHRCLIRNRQTIIEIAANN